MIRLERIEKIFFYLNVALDNAMEAYILKYAGVKFLGQNTKVNLRSTMKSEDGSKTYFDLQMPVEKLYSMRDYMGSELNRSFINDLYSIVYRHCIFIIERINSENSDDVIAPEITGKKLDQVPSRLNKFLPKESKDFLDFFHKVRNCQVHYDGRHNDQHRLDYEFVGVKFKTTDSNLGQPIEWGTDATWVEMYDKLKQIFDYSEFSKNEYFIRRVMR